MWKDSIVEEVRRTREAHAAKFGHDLRAIFEDLRRQEERSGREVVSFPPRRPSAARIAFERGKTKDS